MLKRIEDWIDLTNERFSAQRQSCSIFTCEFEGFYNKDFLSDSYFVIVDRIPKPDFPDILNAAYRDFIDMDHQGMTYKNTYYVLPSVAKNLNLHFHELVHVAQWKTLGAMGFLERYLSELDNFNYHAAPLERLAYDLEEQYANGGMKTDVELFIKITLQHNAKN